MEKLSNLLSLLQNLGLKQQWCSTRFHSDGARIVWSEHIAKKRAPADGTRSEAFLRKAANEESGNHAPHVEGFRKRLSRFGILKLTFGICLGFRI